MKKLGNALRSHSFLVVLLAVAVFGLILWWPTASWWGLSEEARSDLGASLVGGGVIGLAILGAERSFAVRQAQEAANLRKHQDRESLRLQLGLAQDFDQIDLRNRDLSGFFLRGKRFTRARLEAAVLDDSNLILSDFSQASLRRATLKRSVAIGATFNGAVLAGCDLTQVNFTDAKLEASDMTNADLNSALFLSADLHSAKLHRANLEDATFSGSSLCSANLQKVENIELATFENVAVNHQTSWPEGFVVPELSQCTRPSCKWTRSESEPHSHVRTMSQSEDE